MRALFIITRTSDCVNHVRAWESFAGAAECITHTPAGIRNDLLILEKARAVEPQIIFYIGAVSGPGNPAPETFRALRQIAPVVNLCSDAADPTWQEVLLRYRDLDCFDLQVSIDGAGQGFVDLVTVTPVDPRSFAGPDLDRDIRCGFSGGWSARQRVSRYANPGSAYRGTVIYQLEGNGQLVTRRRDPKGPYEDHVAFMRRCRIVLNISLAGDGIHHQVKGRVPEAGWAGCALLESAGSPAIDLFPKGAMFVFETPTEASEMLRDLTEQDIARAAGQLAAHTREHYTPRQIYGQILEKLAHVRPTFAWPSAEPHPPDRGLAGDGGQPAGLPAPG